MLDRVGHNLGFREVVFSPDQGLILNGRKLKLQGVCEHHDLGALGAAFNKSVLRYRLELLKEMGVNALRPRTACLPRGSWSSLTSWAFVVSEAFDMWELPKTGFDYARFFPEWVERDVASWVRRDRNHPSLLMWSIGNEVLDTHAAEARQRADPTPD